MRTWARPINGLAVDAQPIAEVKQKALEDRHDASVGCGTHVDEAVAPVRDGGDDFVHQLVGRHVIRIRGIADEAPTTFVQRKRVFPFVIHQFSRVVTIYRYGTMLESHKRFALGNSPPYSTGHRPFGIAVHKGDRPTDQPTDGPT